MNQLQPWIDSWNMPEIYAGIEGKGAADAAYATALELEYCRVMGKSTREEQLISTTVSTRSGETLYISCWKKQACQSVWSTRTGAFRRR